MRIKKTIDYWLEGAKEALETAEELYKVKKYHFALFFAHLAVEKTLKALVVSQTKNHAIPTHDLILLVKKIKFPTSNVLLEQLVEINKFNIRARYNDYKREFYKLATKEYARLWLNNCQKIIRLFKTRL